MKSKNILYIVGLMITLFILDTLSFKSNKDTFENTTGLLSSAVTFSTNVAQADAVDEYILGDIGSPGLSGTGAGGCGAGGGGSCAGM